MFGYLASAAAFLAYEGRLLGLFVLNAVLIVGVKKGDLLISLKRLSKRGRPLPLCIHNAAKVGSDGIAEDRNLLTGPD